MTNKAITIAGELVGIEQVRTILEDKWRIRVTTFAVGLYAILVDDPLPLRRALRTCTAPRAAVEEWADRQAMSRPGILDRAGLVAPRGERNSLIRMAREMGEREAPRKATPVPTRGSSSEAKVVPTALGYVYFIQAGEDGPIKIGRTLHLRRRFVELQLSSSASLRVLHYVSGGADEELAMHRRFHDARLHGEWFRPTRALLAFIPGDRRSKGMEGRQPAPMP